MHSVVVVASSLLVYLFLASGGSETAKEQIGMTEEQAAISERHRLHNENAFLESNRPQVEKGAAELPVVQGAEAKREAPEADNERRETEEHSQAKETDRTDAPATPETDEWLPVIPLDDIDNQTMYNNLMDHKAKRGLKILNLGSRINSPGLEYCPEVSPDGGTLFFVSNRIDSVPNRDGDPSHDVWLCDIFQNRKLDHSAPYSFLAMSEHRTHEAPPASERQLRINTPYNEGPFSFSGDGSLVIFSGCNRPDGVGDCDLYEVRIENGRWSAPRNMGPVVNSEDWDSQPSISHDGSRLFFASNRSKPARTERSPSTQAEEAPRDLKDIDIWYSERDPTTGEWQAPVHTGSILNTAGTDWSPYICRDGKTLLLASNGREDTYGGYDIYVAQLMADGTWSEPVNAGPVVNSPSGESFASLNPDGNMLYLASTRMDLPGAQGGFDLYVVYNPCTQSFCPGPAPASSELWMSDRPQQWSLEQNVPNPAASGTQIAYSVRAGMHVKLRLYDANGRIVDVLVDAFHEAGEYTVSVDAAALSEGTYYYSMKAAGAVQTRSLLVRGE